MPKSQKQTDKPKDAKIKRTLPKSFVKAVDNNVEATEMLRALGERMKNANVKFCF